MSSLAQRSPGRIDCIEVLRAFAVLLVVVHHIKGNLITSPSPGMSRFYEYFNGTGGVDLFFAISGFVITRSLLAQLPASKERRVFWRATLAFWIRRAWRLLPSAWLWLALILLCTIFYNQSGIFGSLQTNLAATAAAIFNVANFRFADAFGRYFYGASFVYWSLSLEWQFYLLLPVAFLVFRRRLPYVLSAAVIVQLLSGRSLLLMMVRTDAILLGVLLALSACSQSYRRSEPVRLKTSRAMALSILALLLFALVAVPSKAMKGIIPLPMSMVALISFVLVWLASFNKGYILPIGWLRNLLCWVGGRSYAIYVSHIPVFYALRETWHRAGTDRPGPAFSIAIALGAILLLSELNYRFIEHPLRKKGTMLARRLSGGPRAWNSNASETPDIIAAESKTLY